MPNIKFLKDYTVSDGSGTTYQAGQVVDLPADSCQHFVSRRVAEETKEKVTPAQKKSKRETAAATDSAGKTASASGAVEAKPDPDK